jgi:hypothetical protein
LSGVPESVATRAVRRSRTMTAGSMAKWWLKLGNGRE